MRLIDADRLKEVIERNFYGYGWDDVAKQLIDAQTTIDPVKHGYWEFKMTLGVDPDDCYAQCSCCGAADCDTTTELSNYCPNCGAKMDEKEGAKNHE